MWIKRVFGERAVKAKVMSTELFIRALADKKILLNCVEIAKDFEEKLSAYKETSYISQINKMAGKEPVQCPPLVLDIIKQSLEVAEKTNGKFDPTVGVLTQKTYGFGTGKEKIPTEEELLERKKLVNYKDVEIFKSAVFLKKQGMALDLGGIGKGYASQLLIEYLQKQQVEYALVSIGGEICCYGKNWKIAIKHPREDKNLAVLTTTKEPTTISTSGDYERYIKDINNHHIIDTQKGKQNNYYSSLTLITKGLKGGILDAYTTALFNTENIENLQNLPFEMFYVDKNLTKMFMSFNFISQVENISIFN